MATAAERMRALRERARRGILRLAIDVSEDDLREIARAGYEGALTTDHDQQAQAVGLSATRFYQSDGANLPSRTRNDTYPLGLQTRS